MKRTCVVFLRDAKNRNLKPKTQQVVKSGSTSILPKNYGASTPPPYVREHETSSSSNADIVAERLSEVQGASGVKERLGGWQKKELDTVGTTDEEKKSRALGRG